MQHLIKLVEDGSLHDLGALVPPKWIDREQKPILHPRITVTNWRRQERLDL